MSTPWSVFQDGRMGSPQPPSERADAEARRGRARRRRHNRGDGVPRRIESPAFWPPPQSTPVHAPSRSADRLVAVPHPTGRIAAPIRFPPDNFKHSLTLFSKGLGPGPPPRTLLRTTPTTEPPDSKAGPFPLSLAAVTRGILRRERKEGPESERATAAATKTRVGSQPPHAATSVDVDPHLGRPRARGARRPHPPATPPRPRMAARGGGGDATRDAQCARAPPNGFGRATCVQRLDGSRDSRNSHQVSHFATFFIDARAEISVAESRFRFKSKDTSARARARGGGPSIRIPRRFRRAGARSPARAREHAQGTGGSRTEGAPKHPAPARAPPALFQTSSRVVRRAVFRQ
ncbi:hypothetical protein RND71_019102 [Anisodus tanguticus]|uniref:Uncharacterized protein n=1 Tax=Anisodus tanguticus TaxID=243964 RepID=A0AAE1RYT3_9SOLA|nr:hypothetical protein RND71_019102 [Anisodus tanguticus]